MLTYKLSHPHREENSKTKNNGRFGNGIRRPYADNHVTDQADTESFLKGLEYSSNICRVLRRSILIFEFLLKSSQISQVSGCFRVKCCCLFRQSLYDTLYYPNTLVFDVPEQVQEGFDSTSPIPNY